MAVGARVVNRLADESESGRWATPWCSCGQVGNKFAILPLS
jgi:hypothetical protein